MKKGTIFLGLPVSRVTNPPNPYKFDAKQVQRGGHPFGDGPDSSSRGGSDIQGRGRCIGECEKVGWQHAMGCEDARPRKRSPCLREDSCCSQALLGCQLHCQLNGQPQFS